MGGEERRFAIGSHAFGTPDAAHRPLDLGVFGRERVPCLLVAIANAGEAAIERRDAIGIGRLDQIADDGLWRGGQRSALVLLTPGREVSPVGSAGFQSLLGVAALDLQYAPAFIQHTVVHVSASHGNLCVSGPTAELSRRLPRATV